MLFDTHRIHTDATGLGQRSCNQPKAGGPIQRMASVAGGLGPGILVLWILTLPTHDSLQLTQLYSSYSFWLNCVVLAHDSVLYHRIVVYC